MPSSGQMTQRAASGPAWWLALAGVSAVLIAPLFLTEMPPLLD